MLNENIPQFITAVRRAITNNEFEIYYQPVFDIETGRIGAFEALLRWNSPQGLISPGSFIPVAEECGVIIDIGRWVTDRVCKDITAWYNSGRNVPAVSINYSDREFNQVEFINNIYSIVVNNGLTPDCIMMEFSEDTLNKNLARSTEKIRELQRYGFKISIDNFGRNASSIAILRDIECDTIKIDEAFIKGAVGSIRGHSIVHGFVQLIRSLDINTIAERIENEYNLDTARSFGFNMVQGYYFSAPLKARDAELYIV